MEVVSLKLVNGEEWVGREQQTLTDNKTTLTKARRIGVVYANGEERLMLSPICLANLQHDTFTVQNEFIVTKAPVSTEFEKNYQREVSGILVA